jgi:hypothetical protein
MMTIDHLRRRARRARRHREPPALKLETAEIIEQLQIGQR